MYHIFRFSLTAFSDHHLEATQSVEADINGGELLINIDQEAWQSLSGNQGFQLGIKFRLENPTGGVHFITNQKNKEGKVEEPQMFTYAYENSSRLWFPCVDSFASLCTWKLEITVPKNLIAVASGDLQEKVMTKELKHITFHYVLNTPVSAPNIGLAIGCFEIHVNPHRKNITSFCVPNLLQHLKCSERFVHGVFDFYEEVLSTRYNSIFNCYKQVYVNELDTEISAYATMSIVSVDLLHSLAIIEQVYITRTFLARGIAAQFFGCFINAKDWFTAWLVKGIAEYLVGLHTQRFFGNNEYRTWIQDELARVVKYEQEYGGIILDNSRPPTPLADRTNPDTTLKEDTHYFSIKSAHTVSPLYMEAMRSKAHLVIRMLQHRLGDFSFLRLLRRHISVASEASKMDFSTDNWQKLLISTSSFTHEIYSSTGKDMSIFMDQWVRTGGHAKFTLNAVFNRLRNVLEVEIRQDHIHERGVRMYRGVLILQLQELDGPFQHTLQIERAVIRADIVLHSKARRYKKKKIPLSNEKQMVMDLSQMG